MSRPFTRWQRLIAHFLPWYDTDEQARRIQRTDDLVEATGGRIESIRIGYRKYGDRVGGTERRGTSR